MLSYMMKLYAHLLVLTCVLSMARVWVHATSMDRMKITEPSVLLEEGRPAEIPCLTIGRHDAYIWMKGYSIENSTELASFIDGIASEVTSHFTVSENGTLLIEKVRLKDEGKYLCRASSEISDCTGEIMVYVQAVLDKFALGVDLCQSKSDCAIFINPSQATTVTCRANNAPHSMDLKWFNGSREITDGIVLGSRVVQGDLSYDISSTLNIVDTHPSLLTCQAVDQKRLNDEGLFVNVQLKAPVTSEKPSPAWMVIAIILLIICLVTTAAIAIMAVRSRQHREPDKEKQNGEQERLLETAKEENEKLIRDLKAKQKTEIKEKDEIIKDLKVEQKTAIQDLKTDQKTAIEEKDKMIKDLKADQKTALEEKDKMIKELKAEQKTAIEEKDDMIKNLKESGIKEKNDELQRLKGKQDNDIKEMDNEVKRLKEERERYIKDKNTEIHLLKKKQDTDIKVKDDEIHRLKFFIEDPGQKKTVIARLQEELKKKTDQLTNKVSQLEGLKTDIKQKEVTITKLNGALKKRNNELQDNKLKLKNCIVDAENEGRKLRMDKMKLKETVQFVCKITPSPGGKEQLKRTETNSGWTIKAKDTSAKFNIVYTPKAENEEVSEAAFDLLQNAIDGGTSCIISYATSGEDHVITMAGSLDGRSEGFLMNIFQRLFQMVDSLREKDIEVDLSARYVIGMKTSTEDPSQINIINYQQDKPTSIAEVVQRKVSNFKKEKETLEEYLKHIKGVASSIISPDFIVEYYINTTVDKTDRTSGKILFATFCGLEQIRQCFRSDSAHIFELPRVVSEAIYNEDSYSLLITHLSEERLQETKKTLEVIQKVQETGGKKFWKRMFRKKNSLP